MRHRIIVSLLTVLSLHCFSLPGEAQTFGLGGSVVLDRLVTDAVQAIPEEKPAEPAAPGEGVFRAATAPGAAEEAPFWVEQWFSVLQQYRRLNSSLQGDRQTNVYYTAPELHMKAVNGFSLDASIGYIGTSAEDDFGNDSDSNGVLLVLTPVQEFRFNQQTTIVHAGIGLSYRHQDFDSEVFQRDDETEVDALGLAPALLLTQVLASKVSATLGAVYAYDTSDNESTLLGHVNDSNGVVSVLGRVDGFFPGIKEAFVDHNGVQVWGQAAWKHDTETAEFPVPVKKDDWAEFGVYGTWYLPQHLGFHVGYSVEALRVDSINHIVEARVEYDIF